jgi:hypothetical protein
MEALWLTGTHVAHGHHLHADHHAEEAAKSRVEHHGKK